MIYVKQSRRRWYWPLLRIWYWPRPVPPKTIVLNNITVGGRGGIEIEGGRMYLRSGTVIEGNTYR